MADLAEYLNGFGITPSHVVYYLAYHRTPLTVWGGGLESYGASALFQLYLLEQFGEQGDPDCPTGWTNEWTRKLIEEQGNSIDGIETATGAAFNDLYDAWILANYMDDPSLVGAGGYPLGYNEIDLAPYTSLNYWPLVDRPRDQRYLRQRPPRQPACFPLLGRLPVWHGRIPGWRARAHTPRSTATIRASSR